MNSADPHLIQILTGKTSHGDLSLAELQDITARYPYYALGHLLLAKKYKEEHPELFNEQLLLCVAHFPNLTWVESRLYTAGPALQRAASAQGNGVPALTAQEPPTAAEVPVEKQATGETTEGFTLQINDVRDEPELPPLDEEEIAAIDDTANETAAKIADVLQQQVDEFKTPVRKETPVPVSTEPFHTVDYFASQGIKVDGQAQDALSKKVHTFTDWLRQMKRISHHPTDLGSDPEMENYVQAIADTSNQWRAIDTEAMAEVFVKQGKLEKAIEVYEKLSLLNPGKTAYFAAKINYLKAS